MPESFTGHLGIGGMEFKGERGGQIEVPEHIAHELVLHHGAKHVSFTPDIRMVPKGEEKPLVPPPAADAQSLSGQATGEEPPAADTTEAEVADKAPPAADAQQEAGDVTAAE